MIHNPDIIGLFPTYIQVKKFADSDSPSGFDASLAVRAKAAFAEHSIDNKEYQRKSYNLFNLADWDMAVLKWRFVKEAHRFIETIYGTNLTKDGYKMMMTAFAAVYKNGSRNALHHHGSANFVGVYYPEVGDEATPEKYQDSGVIGFSDMRIENNGMSFQKVNHEIQPTRGMMIIFPAHLHHYVNTYMGDSERVCIAVDITIMKRDFDSIASEIILKG